MKKTLALFMTIALVICAVVIPVLAEETAETTDQTTSATVQTGKGGRGGWQMMPRNGQMPQQPDQNGQQPQMPGNNQDGQQAVPGRGNRNMKHGNGRPAGKTGKQNMLDQLLKDGVITQEVYDAITNYLKEQMPQKPENSTAAAEESAPMVPTEGNEPAEGSEPPTIPEGESGTAEEQLLKELLDSGAITQEQYDQLMGKFAAETGNT